MLEQLAIALIITLIITYYLCKDSFHPAVIMNGLWMVMTTLYAFTDHPLNPLSDKFCIALALWVFPFILVSIVVGRIISNTTPIFPQRIPQIKFFLKLYPFVIIYVFVYILTLLYYSSGSLLNLRNYLVFGNFPPFLKTLMYLNNLMIGYVIYGFLNYNYFEKKKLFILLACVLLVSIFNSNKTGFLSLFVSALYIYKVKVGKWKIRHLAYIFSALLLLLIIVTVNRGDLDYLSGSENPEEDYLYTYLLSPLAAFDLLLNSNAVLDYGEPGSATFSFFYKILNSIGANYKITDFGGWVHVPLITNVFTIMRGYYMDWGMTGIFIMSLVMGVIWGSLYALQKKNYPVYMLLYALIVCYLFFQTFGDYFWNSFSVVIQYYVISIILSPSLKSN